MKRKTPETLAEWLADHIEDMAGEADGWVYFIRTKKTKGAVKIGYTKHLDVEKRRSILQTGNPYKLEVVAVVRGSRVVEKMLHHNFARWRMQGEWFRAADDLTDLIAALAARPQQAVMELS